MGTVTSGADLGALLHLSVLCVGLTFAYLGLDRWGNDRAVSGSLQRMKGRVRRSLDPYLNEAKTEIVIDPKQKEIANELLRGSSSSWLSLLCCIAGLPAPPIASQPGLVSKVMLFWVGFFRDKFDRTLIAYFATASVVGFIVLVGVDGCPVCRDVSPYWVYIGSHIFFVVEVITLLLVVGLVLWARIVVDHADKECKEALKTLERWKTLLARAEYKAADSPLPPPPDPHKN